MQISNGDPVANNVEIVAFLTTPGVLTISQGDIVKSFNASAGLVAFNTTIVPGTTPSFALLRDGKTIISKVSDYPIQTSVNWQDFSYKAGGGIDCDRPGDTGNGYYTCTANEPTNAPSSTVTPTANPSASTGERVSAAVCVLFFSLFILM